MGRKWLCSAGMGELGSERGEDAWEGQGGGGGGGGFREGEKEEEGGGGAGGSGREPFGYDCQRAVAQNYACHAGSWLGSKAQAHVSRIDAKP